MSDCESVISGFVAGAACDHAGIATETVAITKKLLRTHVANLSKIMVTPFGCREYSHPVRVAMPLRCLTGSREVVGLSATWCEQVEFVLRKTRKPGPRTAPTLRERATTCCPRDHLGKSSSDIGSEVSG